MARRGVMVLAGCVALAGAFTACSKAPPITAEAGSASGTSAATTSSGSTGTTGATGSTGTTMTMTGSGGSKPGGTTSSTGSGAGGASSGSSGGPGKVLTADSDVAQYQSFPVAVTQMGVGVKVVGGPFFVTDVYTLGVLNLYTVAGNDCSAQPQTPVLQAVMINNTAAQWHGIRMPVLSSQTLCASMSSPNGANTATILGFAPY